MKNISVIGSGSWGTALAYMFDKYGHNVTLWSWKEEEAASIIAHRENVEFLPGVKLGENLKVVTDRAKAVEGADIIVTAIPSKYLRLNMEAFVPYIKEDQILLNVSKGIEDETFFTLSEVLEDIFPKNTVAVLSGPSHAEDVGNSMPTACIVAAKSEECAQMLQHELTNENFRLYTVTDVKGVGLGGALKNIIAIAAGICDGIGFGDNIKAAVMTRGMAEMARLGKAMGCHTETFFGLSGMGDLIVTCISEHSRNHKAGVLLGQGKTLQEALDEVHMVVEGVSASTAAYNLAQKYNVKMPITEAVYKVLFDNADVRILEKDLMKREVKAEEFK
ncbi:MAG: NAD(P)H-dependent glycerol-3-phosphate dehydrogenase [Firmicutes bacterium]|nr:NAD(P)H-dependent glycerol-3-phosphate dehydrogenase [Bacillota bacterium]MBQ7242560.1 NAD(P)H-dependent glycerol-3-phosphate dehydrogenase [Bacillota bacterium]MBR0104470.1 NAD(P)H-dependent glycerol-3-phosphate dehydrogenase [Bacillota bacterium]MBR2593859.1 NAD(P)H-dependent glycerol-3-phosphate dehydrogenase [Bacillota bacterium]